MEGRLDKETEKAIQVAVEVIICGCRETTKSVWFPKSQISSVERDGDKVRFDCPRWLLEAKSLDLGKFMYGDSDSRAFQVRFVAVWA